MRLSSDGQKSRHCVKSGGTDRRDGGGKNRIFAQSKSQAALRDFIPSNLFVSARVHYFAPRDAIYRACAVCELPRILRGCSFDHGAQKREHPQGMLSFFGDPWENRTPVSALRGPCLSRLTNGPDFQSPDYFIIIFSVCQYFSEKILNFLSSFAILLLF